MKTILITGGAGFIGGCFVRQVLAEEDTRIVNLDLLTYAGNLDSLEAVQDNPHYTFVHGNIGDRKLVQELLATHQPQAIVNFAAESHVDRSIDAPGTFVETNVVGTLHLLMAAENYWRELSGRQREQFRFLHVSTDEVYGSLGETGKFTETTPYAPNSPYSASKAASDHFVRAFHHTFKLPVVTTNCSNNYGPFQFPEKLIPLMILNAVEGKPLPIYGDGKHVRDWLFVEDHCRAIRRVLKDGRCGEVYNIGGDCERSNLEMVRAICAIVDRLRPNLPHAPCDSLITFVQDRPGHDRRYAIDTTKIQTELGWKPREVFDTGLQRTVEWYLDNPEWVQRVMSGSYRRERLGLQSGRNSMDSKQIDRQASSEVLLVPTRTASQGNGVCSMIAAEPKVRVMMVTYNHANYIRQAIDSVLMQQMNSPFELVIGDDASIDGTREILLHYKELYPERIRLLLHDQNHGGRVNFMRTFHACANSPYVAILDGDDYWTSREKLQKQVDALDAHPDWAMCFHSTRYTWEGESRPDQSRPLNLRGEVTTLRDVLVENYIATSSIMFRGRTIEKLPEWFAELPLGDWPLQILIAQHGDIGFIDEEMSVYRLHPAGRWSMKDPCWSQAKKIEMMKSMKFHVDAEYHDVMNSTISRCYYSLAVRHQRHGRRLQAAKAAARCWLSSPHILPTGRRELLRMIVTGVLPRGKDRKATTS